MIINHGTCIDEHVGRGQIYVHNIVLPASLQPLIPQHLRLVNFNGHPSYTLISFAAKAQDSHYLP